MGKGSNILGASLLVGVAGAVYLGTRKKQLTAIEVLTALFGGVEFFTATQAQLDILIDNGYPETSSIYLRAMTIAEQQATIICGTGNVEWSTEKGYFCTITNWAGWESMDTIAIISESSEELETAAQELSEKLYAISGRTWAISHDDIAGPAIRIDVNSTSPDFNGLGDEAVGLVTDMQGIYIVGKTPIAARHGAFLFLEKLGYRQFFKHPMWEVIAPSLIDIGKINEIREPSYRHRNIHPSAYLYPESEGVGAIWAMRNRLWGTELHEASHTYWRIIGVEDNIAEIYAAHPDLFLPEGVVPTQNHVDWQLKPDHPEVIAMAIEYARSQLSRPPVKRYGCVDTLPINSASITPNDGRGWPPEWSVQYITDLVFGLNNEVAKALRAEFPDKYIQAYNYDLYSATPTFDLEPNLLVIVTNGYNAGPLTMKQQVENMYAKGVLVGIRDYLDIWHYKFDPPTINYDLIRRVGSYCDWGAEVYIGDTGDGWGGRSGLTNYLTAKLLWDADLDINNLLDDFYTKSFGQAHQIMKHYYSIRNVDTPALAESFRALDEAMMLATGNEKILNRIRFLTYYNRYLWFWHNIGITNLTLDELRGFYTFITKTRWLYVIFYRFVESALRNELATRGVTAAEIDALQDFTPPTEAEAQILLAEALTALGQTPSPPIMINPRLIPLEPLSNTVAPVLMPLYGGRRTILIPSDGNEDIEIMVRGYSGQLRWYDPTQMILDYWDFVSPGDPDTWVPVTFQTSIAGYYLLYITRIVPDSALWIDVPNRPASIIATHERVLYPGIESLTFNQPLYGGRNEQYFYVPVGCLRFIFGADVKAATRPAFGEITDPNGIEYPFSFTETTERTFDAPVPGLWKVGINMNIYRNHFWLEGISPLVWHDAQHLLVPA